MPLFSFEIYCQFDSKLLHYYCFKIDSQTKENFWTPTQWSLDKQMILSSKKSCMKISWIMNENFNSTRTFYLIVKLSPICNPTWHFILCLKFCLQESKVDGNRKHLIKVKSLPDAKRLWHFNVDLFGQIGVCYSGFFSEN